MPTKPGRKVSKPSALSVSLRERVTPSRTTNAAVISPIATHSSTGDVPTGTSFRSAGWRRRTTKGIRSVSPVV